MRQYIKGSPSVEALDRGPVVRVRVSHAASFPPEWFEGLTGAPVEISGSNGYYRASGNQISLIILHEALVVSVTTDGVSEAETLAIARSLNLTPST